MKLFVHLFICTMKAFNFLLVVILLVSFIFASVTDAIRQEDLKQPCKPGKVEKNVDGCNQCTCEITKTWTCTRKLCISMCQYKFICFI